MNDENETVFSTRFTPVNIRRVNDSIVKNAFFVISVPYETDIKKLIVKKDNSVIAEKSASENTPAIEFTSVQKSYLDDHIITLNWEASDVDNDSLTYSIFYSYDNGNTWRDLGYDLGEKNFEASFLHSTQNQQTGKFMVTVSDGVNVSLVESDKGIEFKNNKPSCFIIEPLDSFISIGNEPIIFHGIAFDSEDGTLQDSSLVWSSDKDGILFKGNDLLKVSSELSEGVHIITLTATDSEGDTSNYSIYVKILRKAPKLFIKSQEDITVSTDKNSCDTLIEFKAEVISDTTFTTFFLLDSINISSPHRFPVGTSKVWIIASNGIGRDVKSFFYVTVHKESGGIEVCDGIDNNCNGQIDEGCETGAADTFYSKSSGDLHNTATWGANPDGSGDAPADFGTGKTFTLANRSGNYTLTGNWTVNGVLMNPAGSSLQINGHTLSLAGLSGEGALAGSATSSLVIAGSNAGDFGTINFTGEGGILKAFTLNRSGAATIGTPVSIYDELTVTNGTLYTGDRLTLKSTSDNTARVMTPSGSISGNVTVERYISDRRAWRLINAPVGGNQSVNDAWQEGTTLSSANPNPFPGYGTIITKGSPADGFDQDLPRQDYSILTYHNPTDSWTGVTNTRTTPVNQQPYFLFVRGDRSITTTGSSATTLRATGSLNVGDQVIPVNTSGFTAVANPFASPIDFATITRNNVDNSFYVWDPKMGGSNGVGAYVNISHNGTGYDITPEPVSPESRYIQSGQSFMVHASGGTGSLIIKESDKSATPAENVFKVKGEKKGDLPLAAARNAYGIRVSLQDVNRALLDEVFTSYSHRFRDEIDGMDVRKLYNVRENISLVRTGHELMVERRSTPDNADTLYLKLGNLKQQSYFFEMKPIDLENFASVWLEDSYTKTTMPVSTTENTQVSFQVTEDAASTGSRVQVPAAPAAQACRSCTGNGFYKSLSQPGSQRRGKPFLHPY